MKIIQADDLSLVLNPWWARTEWRCPFCTCIFMLDASDHTRVLLQPKPDKLIASANCPCCAMKHQDTFTLWGVQEPNSGHVLDTYATREIARNACGKRYKPVKLERRIVPQYPKKPKKPKA